MPGSLSQQGKEPIKKAAVVEGVSIQARDVWKPGVREQERREQTPPESLEIMGDWTM